MKNRSQRERKLNRSIYIKVKGTGCDVNERTPLGGWPPIVLAASKGYTKVVAKLLSLGADINARVNRGQDTGLFAGFDLITFDGSSAIYLASHEGHCETLKYLISKGANVDQKKTNGSTVRLQAVHIVARVFLILFLSQCNYHDQQQ